MKSTACDCSLIIPTHNRRAVLRETLDHLAALADERFEVIVVDNGSDDGTCDLHSQYPDVHWIELGRNHGSAARNLGVAAASGRVLLMLDDDSWPEDGTIEKVVALFDRRPDLGAVACRVRLSNDPERHDAGGVPGIFFNCGGAIRRSAFIETGGYPIDYDYYVEEYDLCCRLWKRGYRVEPHGDLVVWHGRVSANRDNNRMMRLLVRNNLRLWRTYAPQGHVDDLTDATLERYWRVAQKENARRGFREGLRESRKESEDASTRRRPLTVSRFENMFGLVTARQVLRGWAERHSVKKIAVWSRGKGCEQLVTLLASLGIEVDAIYDDMRTSPSERSWRDMPLRFEREFRPEEVDGIIAGSLSPGVAEDLCRDIGRRVAGVPVVSPAPWMCESQEPLSAAV